MYYQKDKLSQDLLADVLHIARGLKRRLLTSLIINDEKNLKNTLTLDGETLEFNLSSPKAFTGTEESIKKDLYNRWSFKIFEGAKSYYRFGDNINEYFVYKDSLENILTIKVPFRAIDYQNYFDVILTNLTVEILLKLRNRVDFVSFDKMLPDIDKNSLYKEVSKKLLPNNFVLYQNVILTAFPNIQDIWYEIVRSMAALNKDQKTFIDNLPNNKNVSMNHMGLGLYSIIFTNILAAVYIMHNYPLVYPKLVKLLHNDEWTAALENLQGAPKKISDYLSTGTLNNYIFQYRPFAIRGYFPYLFMLIFNENNFKYERIEDIIKVLHNIKDYSYGKISYKDKRYTITENIIKRLKLDNKTIEQIIEEIKLRGEKRNIYGEVEEQEESSEVVLEMILRDLLREK